MNVNPVNAKSIQQFFTNNNGMSNSKPMNMRPPGMSMDRAEFSKNGQFFSSLKTELGNDERAEVKGFLTKAREKMKSGNIDAAAMAENAPESLKNLAEKNGIDLEDMLNSMSKRMEMKNTYSNTGMQSKSSLFTLLSSQNTDFEKSELMELFSKVAESTKDGTFDASALLEDAPESILSFANSENIDLVQLFNNMNTRITERMAK